MADSLPGLSGASSLGQAGLGLEGVGLGLGIAGGIGQAQAASGISQASQNIAALQQQQNAINWQQAIVGARRNQLQLLRNAQQSRAVAMAAATNQGGQFGSGLGGGLGNISGEEISGLSAISKNEQLGARMYTVNQSISAQEQQIAKYQGQAAMWGGISGAGSGATSLGSSFVSSATNPSGSLFGGPNA